MKWKLLFSFLAMAVMLYVMRWQGASLVTPASRYGIVDLEFASNAGRLRQLQLFWNRDNVFLNVYLDFLLIGAYTWFFVTCCIYLRQKSVFPKWNATVMSIAVGTAIFDVCENFLMMLIYNGRFTTSLLPLVAGIALVKFLMAAVVVLYVLVAMPYSLMTGSRRHRPL